MTGAGPRLAPQRFHGTLPHGRNLLAHLLHALNQPLTGLQCSLELAAASPQRREEYVRTLREGLELTGRMRILVEAIRELADTQPSDTETLRAVPVRCAAARYRRGPTAGCGVPLRAPIAWE
jgi:signal transduction histidine kinase